MAANFFSNILCHFLFQATKLNDVKSCKGTAFWMAPEVCTYNFSSCDESISDSIRLRDNL